MNIIFEFLKFIIYSGLVVVIAKYALVPTLRKLAQGLNLKPKAVGNIAGIATSVPELLTVSFSAFTGLISASSYNIISSNIINTIQYIVAIFLNKNQKYLQNKALKIDLVMAIITIIIPIIMLYTSMEYSISIVPIFLLLFILFYYINHNAHKLYLNKKEEQINDNIKHEKKINGRNKLVLKYSLLLLFICIILYLVGNLLSDTLESLCIKFRIPELVIGVLLGFITSIPELITFFESQKHHQKQANEEAGVVEATNNLLTSNILNLFIIQSIGVVIFAIFE